MRSVAHIPTERRAVLCHVQLQPKAPLISGWVWVAGAMFAAGMWIAELLTWGLS